MTEEQRERAERNRQRALEIQRRRKLEQQQQQQQQSEAEQQQDSSNSNKRLKASPDTASSASTETAPAATPGAPADKKSGLGGGKKEQDDKKDEDGEDEELEDFEIGASDWVTKKEAKEVYCLPEGTLAVCKYEERPNPHNKQWKPMKLYCRAQVRKFARQRFGGLQGLVDERCKRQDKKYEKDVERTKNLFR